MVDAILVERACKGDGEAFGEIYGQVYENCVKYIRGMCKDETLAEQVVQDTVLHFIEDDYRVLKNLQDYSKFESYFFSAATNHFRNIYKRGQTKDGDVREVIVDEIYDVNEDARLDRYFGVNESMTPEELLEHQELKEILMSMVDELPESQREVVYLHYFNEWKQREVAEYFEANLNTIKSALQRAKESLYKKVEAYEKKTGTKLHSVVPILPFLRLIYASEEIMRPDLSTLLASAGTAAATGTAGIGAASAASAGSGTAAATATGGGTAVAATVGASTTTGAAVAAGAAAKVGGGIVTKVIAGVLAAAVVGTGAVVVPKVVDNAPVDEPVINETVIIQSEDHNGEIDLSWLDEELRPAVTSMEVDPTLGAKIGQFIKNKRAEMDSFLQKDYTFMVDDGYTSWYESADGYQKGVRKGENGNYAVQIYTDNQGQGGVLEEYYYYRESDTSDRLRNFMYSVMRQAEIADCVEYYGDTRMSIDIIDYFYDYDSGSYSYELRDHTIDEYGYATSEYIGKNYSFMENGFLSDITIVLFTSSYHEEIRYHYTQTSFDKPIYTLSTISIYKEGKVTNYTVDGAVIETYEIPELVM